MSFILLAIIGNIVCWKLKDWKNWKKYYPTIIYVFLGNLVCDVLTYNRPLWAYGGIFYKYPVLDLLMMALLYPASIIIYLSHYPARPYKQVLYIFMWTGIFTLSEVVSLFTKGFLYFNGWTIAYSILFDLIMFAVIRLHYKKPMYVWPISATLAILVVWWFRIPLAR